MREPEVLETLTYFQVSGLIPVALCCSHGCSVTV